MEYAKVEPFGEERADLRMAIGTSTLANCWAGKGRRTKVADFMPHFEPQEKPKQSMDEMKALLRRWTAMCGGTVTAKPQA